MPPGRAPAGGFPVVTAATAIVPAFGEVDLTNCDREPIRIPGSVQPHGLLLILHPETLDVLQYGGDSGLLPVAPRPGAKLSALLPAPAVAELAALLDAAPLSERVAIEAALPDGHPIDLVAHRAEAGILLEIERLAAPSATRRGPLPVVQAMVARVQQAATLRGFWQAATDEVRRVTGFDRVMLYRFLPDGSGAVVAEARDPGIGSYLDLHYPASDIPKQARELYQRTWLRLIPDARYTPAPLRPALSPLTGGPADLSLCALRSVSPLHLEYLQNMGVRASMSLSVVRGGQLWGLIACHHRAPRHLPLATRDACEAFAQIFSLQLEAKEQAEDFAYAARLRSVHEGLVQVMAREEDLAFGLIKHRPNLLDFIASEGVALLIDGQYSAIGRVPEEAAVRALVAWMSETAGDGVVAFDRLPELWPPARDFAEVASGVLALSVSRDPRDCILWFRPEVLQAVTWAGNPNKPVEVSPEGARLTPRRSFEAWREMVRGRSHPWKAAEIDAAQALRVSLLEVVLRRMDEVAQERAMAKDRQDLLLAELDHRVKNTLANIQALVRHSSGGAATLEDFVGDLHRRLRSMAAAHSLLSRARWEGAELRSLVEQELGPHLDGQSGPARVAIAGPAVRLRPKAALAISLALHELTTNAAKYGALSAPGGMVHIAWGMSGGKLLLDWQERGGPPVSAPTRRGFGLLVIERSLAYEVNGRSRLDFAPAGVAFHVEMPLRQVTESSAVLAAQPPPAPPAPLRGVRVLVVEDAALVALELETALRVEGAEVVGPVARLEDALAVVKARLPDAALLDIDLDGVTVFPLADALAEAGVPFLLTTGYEPGLVLPARFAAVPVLAKPYRGEEATAALRGLLAKR